MDQSLHLFFVVTLLGLFYSLIPALIKLVMTVLGAATNEQLDMMSELSELKKKMNQISITDEFARYAKLQRQVNKLRDQIKARGTEKNIFLVKLKWGSTFLLYLIYVSYFNSIIHGLICYSFFIGQSSISVYISWNYRSQPLLRLPNDVFHPFFPIGYILAFPCGIQGMHHKAYCKMNGQSSG